MSLGSVLLVGCGKMGGAMARGWLKAGVEKIVIVEPYPAAIGDDLANHPKVTSAATIDALGVEIPSTVVLAVKPQMMAAALEQLAPKLSSGALVVTIAAGKVMEFYRQYLPKAALVRAMPNLPASIGKGISVAVASPEVTPAQKATAEALLKACGEVGWVPEEPLLDPVTALSGGGPAYVFNLVEAMAAAGVAAGLEADLAMRLARNTVAGSGALLDESELPAATLRENVCSPGGTTIEAIKILRAEPGLEELMTRAIGAASARATELGKL
ncbi:pyrroline-5-carboxylate reductase [Lacibacterium aquatile]|uniref:Pyrroline-5-carboxylate reductase n=1 Tax=Lacibacterium aquatile TaxID=1168082 RepID=A0ABW5DUJ3_9PROT